MDAIREIEEKLREASCNGDEEAVLHLLEKAGVNVNCQHGMNGWTPLHWASKRNHPTIVQHLLKGGADRNIQNHKEETPLQLTTNAKIRTLLGGETSGDIPHIKEQLPITPNYIRHPQFPYATQPKERPMHADLPINNRSVGQGEQRPHNASPAPTAGSFYNSGHRMEDDELVLKARVANAAETDFIEMELDRRRMTFENLLSTMCKELEIKRELVIKVRKMPDTIVRKDKDVKRLRDFQELELVLSNRAISESSRNYTSSVSPKHVDVVY